MIISRLTHNAELGALLGRYRGALAPVVALSVALNLLALTGSIYLMLVYDRVLLSGSLATLASIFAIVIVLYAFQSAFDTLRARLLQMVGQGFDSEIAPRLQRLESALQVATPGASANPLRDLDQVRNFLGSAGPGAIIDLPWIVFFLLVLLLIHPALALTTLAGALVLGFVTLQNDRRMRALVKEAGALAAEHHAAAESVRRNAGAIRGLGIGERMDDLVIERRRVLVSAQARLARLTARYSALSKGLRMLVQSGVLTTGAVLVIDRSASAGVIFASSILAGRALAPVDQAIANWRGFVGAREAWNRLNRLLDAHPPQEGASVALPLPSQSFQLEGVRVTPPAAPERVLAEASVRLGKGDVLAIVGPSGSGKSSLLRSIVGIWPPAAGAIRLDGAPLEQYTPEVLRDAVGYLPQEVELLSGTIAQNIAGFESDPSSDAIIAAARAAAVDQLVLRLPQGYDTPIGQGGSMLSAGQRQRIALARALYREPFLLVLDEPDSSLDPEGEAALCAAIAQLRASNRIMIVATHRAALLREVTLMLVMRDGKAQAFGPRDTVLAALNGKAGAKSPAAAVN